MNNTTWVVTAYYNPAGYRSRRENLVQFLDGLGKLKVPVLVVEMLGANGISEVDESNCERLSLRQAGSTWQKECLLNIGARSLPKSVRNVIWSDCDLIFERSDWLSAASETLSYSRVIQPFTTMTCLSPDGFKDVKQALTYQSFCSNSGYGSVSSGFKEHGHPGFAWGARRELFDEVGLYDRALAGSADHLMAHAFANDLSSVCLDRTFGNALKYKSHFLDWARRAALYSEGQIAAVPGKAYHLWHGRFLNRRYLQREKELADMDFDPEVDVNVRSDGMLTINIEKTGLERWANGFFAARQEDEMYQIPQPNIG